MTPIQTSLCNFVFTAPPGQEETVGDLHCLRDTRNGTITSFWTMDAQERAAFAASGIIAFTVFSASHPVVSLGVIQTGHQVTSSAHHERTWTENWKPILEGPDGQLDLDAVKRELHDYSIVIDCVSKVYDEITCGRFSKCTTDAIHIIDEVNSRIATAVTNSLPPESIRLIMAERSRQITEKGWTPEHDETHIGGQLSDAAACYADVAGAISRGASPDALRDFYIDCTAPGPDWPFEDEAWNPSPDPIRNLVKAGALIVAEIERLQRLNTPSSR